MSGARRKIAVLMSLGQKTLAILSLTIVGLMAVLYLTTRALLIRSFLELEQIETRDSVRRARSALDNQIADLTATANDYSAWDRTYSFMQRNSGTYIKQEFENDTLQGLSINTVLLVDVDGKPVFSKRYDFLAKREIPFPLDAQKALASDPWVRQAGMRWSCASGIYQQPETPVLIAACPILTTDRKGPERGVLVMTRNLDAESIQQLRTLTLSSIQIESFSKSRGRDSFGVALLPASDNAVAVRPVSAITVAGCALLRDIHGKPALLLRVDAPRAVFREAIASLHYFLGALFVVGIGFGLTTILLLRLTVLSRLTRLSEQVGHIGGEPDSLEQVTVSGRDELSQLASAINAMLQALSKSERQFRQITDNIHQVFWVREVGSAKFSYISPACERVWGLKREDIGTDPELWPEPVHPDDMPAVRSMLDRQDRGEHGEAEFRMMSADGAIRWVWNRYFPVCDSGGRLTQIVGLAEDVTESKKAEDLLLHSQEDLEYLVKERTTELAQANDFLVREITERKQAEEARQASEQQFRQLFATIPLPVWLYDARNLMFLEVNDATEEHYGYSREEFLSMTIEQILPAAEVERLHGDLHRPHNSIAFSTSRKHRTKDGRQIDVEIHSHQLEFRGAPAILVAARDVTERSQMEIELRHGQKLQAVGELAAGIAHEINTPIQFVGDNIRFLSEAFTSLAILLELSEQMHEGCRTGRIDVQLLEELDAAKAKADLPFLRKELPLAFQQTVDGIGRVAAIVRALKKFSHFDVGREQSAADLNDALESTILVARNELKYVADVETHFDQLPPVTCHLGDLNQVFLNLLVNAAHSIGDVVHNSGKKGQIVVETRLQGESVEVAIRDTGTGIPPEIQGRIFDPFFTTKEVGKGTGQGLALARAIVVDKHGGTLTFDTIAGKGTTFYVRIPVNGTSASQTQRP
jgi:PAS domain S-box-containing protein